MRKIMCNSMSGPILVVIVTLHLGAQNAVVRAPDLYSKVFADGTEIYLTRQTIIEIRSRPKDANPGIPEQDLFSAKQVRIVTYSLRLRSPEPNKESLIWETTYTDPDDDLQKRELVLRDVFHR
jgi:hypothetical protein